MVNPISVRARIAPDQRRRAGSAVIEGPSGGQRPTSVFRAMEAVSDENPPEIPENVCSNSSIDPLGKAPPGLRKNLCSGHAVDRGLELTR